METKVIDLAEVKAAIKEWRVKRSRPDQVITYLNQGNCIEVTRAEYVMWKTRAAAPPLHIHAYMGLFSGKLKLILVDSITDADPVLNPAYIVVKDYTHGIPVKGNANDTLQHVGQETDEITVLQGLERMFRWSMGKNAWVTKQVLTTNGVFQAFQIPFADFEFLFEDLNKKTVYGLFGLLDDLASPDFIIWNETMKFPNPLDPQRMVADVALPVPPFGSGGTTIVATYQLLVQA
jgi:hypothetical protein